MTFTQHYGSPLGSILLTADEMGLTGLWFDGQKHFARDLPAQHTEQDTPVLSEAKRWLDVYFTGREPDFLPALHPIGSAFLPAKRKAKGFYPAWLLIFGRGRRNRTLNLRFWRPSLCRLSYAPVMAILSNSLY